jgi:hypothetical protein
VHARELRQDFRAPVGGLLALQLLMQPRRGRVEVVEIPEWSKAIQWYRVLARVG